MKNILFISNCLSFGGAEKMLCFVAESLARKGHRVFIVNLRAINNSSDYERTLTGVTVITLDKNDEKQNKHIYRIKNIKKIAKTEKIDVIIGFTAFPNFYATIVGKLLHIPSIMSERGDPNRTIGNSWKDKILTFVINRATGGVFQIDGAKSFYKKGLQKKSITIPNPIFINDTLPNIPFEEREKTVVSVGRLDNKQKRYDVMLDAFKIFVEKNPEYILKLYGCGTDETLIKEWVEQRGLSEKVKFMGLTLQPMQDVAKEGMFLITSDYEGISNSLLEAMAVGLPCVSTDHTPGGARLLIQDHQNGLLAPIGDANRLAEAMGEFANNLELAKKCGQNARAVVERFSPTKIIDNWENYIVGLCK